MNQEDLTKRIITAWHDTYETNDDEFIEFARLAASVMLCGEQHPARPVIVCTDTVGHPQEYHRNTEIGLEWSPAGSGDLRTYHDDLGEIVLYQRGHPSPGATSVTKTSAADPAACEAILSALDLAREVLARFADARGERVTVPLWRKAKYARIICDAAFDVLRDAAYGNTKE